MQHPSGKVYLLGFMASGKTTVGRILADMLARTFMDTDEIVEQRSGQTIASLFKLRGEAYFRQLESQVLSDLLNVDNTVIALGGGIVMSGDNMSLISNSGVTFYLEWPFPVLWERLRDDSTRPLVAREQPAEAEARLRRLLLQRVAHYSRANYRIQCQPGMSAEDIAILIKNKIEGTA